MKISLRKEKRISAEEAKLLELCSAGDARAREELCRRYWPAACKMANRLAGPGIETEDLVQESFCRLLSHIGSLRGEARITTWLYRTMTNLHHDRLRRLARWRECPLEALPVQAGQAGLVSPDPAELVEARWWRPRFVQAVRKLSRRDRQVLWLHFRRDYSHAQIARRLNCTVDAVKCRLYRIMRYLRRELSFES